MASKGKPWGQGAGGAGKAAQQRVQRDAAYRAALGVPDGQQLPAQAGAVESAGAARGGRGAGQRRAAPYHQPGMHVDKRPAADLTLTADQVRAVKCPRCLAGKGQPCRTGKGQAYPRGHAERRRQAATALERQRRRPGRRRQGQRREDAPAPPPLSPDARQRREAYREDQQRRQQTTGTPSAGGGRDPMQAVLGLTTRRAKHVDNGDGVAHRLPDGNRMTKAQTGKASKAGKPKKGRRRNGR